MPAKSQKEYSETTKKMRQAADDAIKDIGLLQEGRRTRPGGIISRGGHPVPRRTEDIELKDPDERRLGLSQASLERRAARKGLAPMPRLKDINLGPSDPSEETLETMISPPKKHLLKKSK